MTARTDKPREYFVKLLDISEDEIDYSEIPRTASTDWEEAEALFPVTEEEFQAIKRFIRERRGQASGAPANSVSE
jgi:hypothetical protein